MKRIVLIALLVPLIFGVYFWFKRIKPPLETKFVQNVKELDTQDLKLNQEEKQTKNANFEIKKPGDYELVDNPKHVYQTFNNCGPATLSMILSWLGTNVSQKELGDQMRPYQIASGDNDDKTIFTYEFVDWAKKYGFETVGRVNGDIKLLKTFTANGIQVVVKTWLKPNEDIGHFRIVRGFDEGKKIIIQDDSYDGPNKRISYYDFLSMWQSFNYAYIIVFPDDKKDLVEEIMEEVDEETAWRNALARAQKEAEIDPENVYPWFNMSSSYYHLGEYQKSIEAFEKVETRLPKRMLWYQIEPIQAYKELGNYDRVFEITDRLLNGGNRAFSELYQIRGEIYLSQGNKDAAKREFELALAYNKNFFPAQESLRSM